LGVVKVMLADPRVDPSALNNTAIQYASANGHVSIVAELMKHPKVNPADDQNFAIRYAAAKGNKLLLYGL
jgi:hypothetical protein